jgi:hypothetical protein
LHEIRQVGDAGSDAPRLVLGEQNCTVEHPNFLY